MEASGVGMYFPLHDEEFNSGESVSEVRLVWIVDRVRKEYTTNLKMSWVCLPKQS